MLRTSTDPWNAITQKPAELQRLLETVRANGYATMNADYAEHAYNGAASAVGVPILIPGGIAGSLNLMYLRHSIDEAGVISRFIVPLQGAASAIARALTGLRAGGG